MKVNLEEFLIFQRIRIAKSLVNFAEKLLAIADDQRLLEDGLFKEWYQFYLDGLQGEYKQVTFSRIQISKILSYYKIYFEFKHKKDQKAHGLRIEKDKLELMINDLKQHNDTTGGTIIYIKNEPHYLRTIIIPVSDTIKKALSGRSGLEKENKN